MPPKNSKKIIEQKNENTDLTIKPKRGRKSKKDIIESLKNKSLLNPILENSISLSVSEKTDNIDLNNIKDNFNIVQISESIDVDNNNIENILDDENIENDDNIENDENIIQNQKPVIKKRGRKPKGGKIIQQITNDEKQNIDKPNVILHLKCSMKDLNQTSTSSSLIESYNFVSKNDLCYDIIGSDNVNINSYNDNKINSYNDTKNISYEYDDDDESIGKENTKEIWKKLKHLEHNLHINNISNKKSACFWDTCEFDNPPIYIPKHFINGTYHVYGCFCSPECAVAYLMNENIDGSTKFERYHLLNHIYSKIYDYKKNIKPAANPYYMLEKYYGNLTIQEYRSLLRNERLFLIVDKPLTRILPELHEDNDEFILNNKIIPSNNYQVKTRLQRKKQNKTTIINEKFGITNQELLE